MQRITIQRDPQFTENRGKASKLRRNEKVSLNRTTLISYSDMLANLADSIEQGNTEFFGLPIEQVLYNIAKSITANAVSGK